MILGPFWCQRDQSWLRFNLTDGVVQAEIAPVSPENPDMAMDWKSINEGGWSIDYTYGNENQEKTFFSLKEGVLYRTDGNKDKYSGELSASELKGESWHPYNVLKGKSKGVNPFSNYNSSDYRVTPYKELPLTVEMKKALLEQELAIEKEKARIQQEEEQRRQEEIAEKWRGCQQKDVRNLIIEAAGTTFFNKATLEILAIELTAELIEVNPSLFTSCQDYLEALKIIIEDSESPEHRAIINLAAKTHIDRDLGLFGNEEVRKGLFEKKKSFFFNLLREEAKYLGDYCGIECHLPSDERVEPQGKSVKQELPPKDDYDFETLKQGLEQLTKRMVEATIQSFPQKLQEINVSFGGQRTIEEAISHRDKLLEQVNALSRNLSVAEAALNFPVQPNHAIVEKSEEINRGFATKKALFDTLSELNFDKHLIIFTAKLDEMQQKERLGYSDYADAAQKAKTFIDILKNARKQFLQSENAPLDEAKKILGDACKNASDTARGVLDKHREWKGAIAKFLIDVTSLLTFGRSDALWCKFGMFSQTDSGRKLDDFEKDMGLKI